MPREFNVPTYYRSTSIGAVKRYRKILDQKKRDLSPSLIDFSSVRFHIARHFGFCFGVENAIEISYRALEENSNKRIFLLSEMIHNQEVNADLLDRGVRFLMNTAGETLIPFSELTTEDIVIVPAFGTTIEIQKQLEEIGIDPYYYDTTCPFVEKVWKRSEDLGRSEFTVIIHGKRTHEETRATFSHSVRTAPTIVVLDMKDTEFLIMYIKGQVTETDFKEYFKNSLSENFDPKKDLKRVGVVNQTTMLATETQDIADAIKQCMIEVYGKDRINQHFADTRDTLCYATNENQNATRTLIESKVDLAIVVGGYNSSNTSHLVELCEEKVPTYYIKNAGEIIDKDNIRHFNFHTKQTLTTNNWLPSKKMPIEIALTSGASCPDRSVDEVMQKITSFFENSRSWEDAFKPFQIEVNA